MYDVAVIGLGIIGSAVLDYLARRGVSVIGIDQYAPPHTFGSSHGQTRALRLSYVEGAMYVPMMKRAIALWRALEARTDQKLFFQTGIRYGGAPDRPLITGLLASSRIHALDVSAEETGTLAGRSGWEIRLPPDYVSMYERDSGYLLAEPSHTAFLNAALGHGAQLVLNRPIQSIMQGTGYVEITLSGQVIQARRVVCAMGPWTASVLPALAPCLALERRVLTWFRDETGKHTLENGFLPFVVEDPDGRWYYGFPGEDSRGVKIGCHHGSDPVEHPDRTIRTVSGADTDHFDRFRQAAIPSLGQRLGAKVCLYTNTPDGDFILDRHPEAPDIAIAAGFSGHGFKFAPLIGEIMGRMALEEEQDFDLTPFAFKRFS